MTTLTEWAVIPNTELSPADLERVAAEGEARGSREVSPGIWKTPDVCGGDACIRWMRLPVWGLEAYRRLGCSDEDIIKNSPSLGADDLVRAWRYVSLQPAEIEECIRQNEEA